MKNLTNLFLRAMLVLLILNSCTRSDENKHSNLPGHMENLKDNPGALLVAEMIESLGGLSAYKKLKDVEYTYTYGDAAGNRDVSLERYIYDGERSWARYDEHTKNVFPNEPGIIIQGFNGTTSWVMKDGILLTDQRNVDAADFLRKTNFYWLNMMFKLLDPGLTYEVQDKKEVDGVVYDVIKVGFGADIGDVQDVYVLYIDPESRLVDKFLFTVMDFGRSEPLLMEVRYDEVEGLKWPVYRRYTPSDWDATIQDGAQWIEEISTDLRFNTGIDPGIFELPQ